MTSEPIWTGELAQAVRNVRHARAVLANGRTAEAVRHLIRAGRWLGRFERSARFLVPGDHTHAWARADLVERLIDETIRPFVVDEAIAEMRRNRRRVGGVA